MNKQVGRPGPKGHCSSQWQNQLVPKCLDLLQHLLCTLSAAQAVLSATMFPASGFVTLPLPSLPSCCCSGAHHRSTDRMGQQLGEWEGGSGWSQVSTAAFPLLRVGTVLDTCAASTARHSIFREQIITPTETPTVILQFISVLIIGCNSPSPTCTKKEPQNHPKMSQLCDKTAFATNILAEPFTKNTQSLLQQRWKPVECQVASLERKAEPVQIL